MNGRRKENVEMICSVSELANLFHEGQDIRGFLFQVVSILSHHMQTQVCSIFLYDENRDVLILEATVGLNKDEVGRLTILPGEGLTGLALKELRPIREGRGQDNPDFKFFPESGEERYESFLAVPIIRGIRRVGVLVLQDEKSSRFSKADAMALRAIASQLAATLENAQLLLRFSKNETHSNPENIPSSIIRGSTIMEGIGIGRAYLIGGPNNLNMRLSAGNDRYTETLDAFRQSISQTEKQLAMLQERLEEELADVASLIFSAHRLMLRDNGFSGEMEKLIQEGSTPSKAIEQITNNYIAIFSSSDNPRLREKVLDVKDLGHRLLKKPHRRHSTSRRLRRADYHHQ